LKDLAVAIERLRRDSSSLVIVKDDKVLFEGYGRGVEELLKAIELLGEDMRGSSLADRVVGKACALLCSYSRVKAVYAKTISEPAIKVLERDGIPITFEERVKNILNPSKTMICPFERLVTDLDDPMEAYSKLISKKRSMPS
jgi:hypothetical protein